MNIQGFCKKFSVVYKFYIKNIIRRKAARRAFRFWFITVHNGQVDTGRISFADRTADKKKHGLQTLTE